MLTHKQSWALKCITGLDVRGAGISLDMASTFIGRAKSGEDIVAELLNLGATGQAKPPKKDWQALYDRAHQAGHKAATEVIPAPMVVQSRSNPMDDNSAITKQWVVPDGMCGFAWIKIRPGNSPFANWLKKEGAGRTDSYAGGVSINVSAYNQSVTRKDAYAQAFAEVLREEGIKAYAESRLD